MLETLNNLIVTKLMFTSVMNNFNNCLAVCIFYKLYVQVWFYVLPVGISQMAIWHFNFDICAF
jgi:hypothetical protein